MKITPDIISGEFIGTEVKSQRADIQVTLGYPAK